MKFDYTFFINLVIHLILTIGNMFYLLLNVESCRGKTANYDIRDRYNIVQKINKRRSYTFKKVNISFSFHYLVLMLVTISQE